MSCRQPVTMDKDTLTSLISESIMSDSEIKAKIKSALSDSDIKKKIRGIVADTVEEMFRTLWQKSGQWKNEVINKN